MIEFRSFQMFLILMIPFTAVTQHYSNITVGDETTLPCKDVKDYQDKCLSTTWTFNYLRTEPTVTLFEYGKIHSDAAAKSDRLSVTEKCSLVIKKVTYEDAGRYICTEYKPGQTVIYSDVDLTVTIRAATQQYSFITVTVGDDATLSCEDVKDLPDKCLSTTWIFDYKTTRGTIPLFEHGKITSEAASKSDRLSVTEKCSLVIKKVTYEDIGHYICKQFISGQTVTDSQVNLTLIKRDNVATPPPTTTTKRTTEASKATTTTTTTTTTIKISTKATTRPATTTSGPAAGETSSNSDLLKVLLPVAVLSAAILIIIVAVIRWKRVKENNTQLDDNSADPPDVVSYASIRYKKTNSKVRVQCEDDKVTYSTLNTSSTSAEASTDPKNLYASMNKTNT